MALDALPRVAKAILLSHTKGFATGSSQSHVSRKLEGNWKRAQILETHWGCSAL